MRTPDTSNNNYTNVEFGCECEDCGIMCECTKSCAPVFKLIERKGKQFKVCTRCDLSSDKTIKLLFDKNTPLEPFMDYDSLGALCMAGMLEQTKENKG